MTHARKTPNVVCPYCGNKAELVDSAVVYGRSYGIIWLCYPCDAYVGVHKNSPRHAPLGRLANKELREWKMRAHEVFDQLWISARMTRPTAAMALRLVLSIDKYEYRKCPQHSQQEITK